MDVRITSLIQGAEEAGGLAVVIDVFRASSSMCTVVSGGGEVVPVASVEDATRLKRENGWKLLAERNREKLDAADFDNSPSKLSEHSWRGETLIMSTSAGTKGIKAAAQNAENVVIGCFLNASALCEYLRNEQPETVTLVAIGKNGMEEAVEDEMCAAYLRQKLQGETADFSEVGNVLQSCPAAVELRNMGKQRDVDYCLRKDVFNTIPVFENGVIRAARI